MSSKTTSSMEREGLTIPMGTGTRVTLSLVLKKVKEFFTIFLVTGMKVNLRMVNTMDLEFIPILMAKCIKDNSRRKRNMDKEYITLLLATDSEATLRMIRSTVLAKYTILMESQKYKNGKTVLLEEKTMLKGLAFPKELR